MRIALFAAAAFVLVAAAAPSRDQLLQVMHERHEGMETIGKTNKVIRREIEAGMPNSATAQSSAAQLNKLAHAASHWFPAGTGPELGKTGAKPEIWQDPKDFAAKLVAFQKAAWAFNAATADNDATATKTRYADLGGTCKACHDKYRSEMHH